jgi:hypothetical protein
MQIDKILAGIRETQNTSKTAAEKPAEKTASTTAPHAALDKAMQDAVAVTEKTAAEKQSPGPVDDVMKIASDLASAEKEAMVKEAQMLGAAWADAAISRINAWREATKTAAVEAPVATASQDPSFAKFAAENPELIKQAQELGYDVTRQGLEKMADDAYVSGYNDTVKNIHKTASVEFLKAASVTSKIIEQQQAAK